MSQMPPKSSFFWFLLAAAVMVLMVLRGMSRGTTNGTDHPAVGMPLPALSVQGLTRVDGQPTIEQIALRDLHGKVVLLNLWGPWCPHCLDELPELAELSTELKGEADFQFVAISYPASATNTQQLRTDTAECLTRLDVDIPTYIDDVGITSQALGIVLGGSHGYPATLVLDQRGIIQGMWLGYSPQAVTQMRTLVQELLVSPPAAETSVNDGKPAAG